MLALLIYVIVALIGIFVVVPFLKARRTPQRFPSDDDEFLFFSIAGSIIWPAAIFIIAGYFVGYKPSVWLFNKSVDMFSPKPKKQLEIDESKSSYRNFGLK